jgi:Spy/CpxP family protein refolding chaperone
MKLTNVLAGVAATVALAGVAVAQPQGMGGPGMMGGYGMMGPGMMGGYGNDAYSGLDLTLEQQKSIARIQEPASKAMWQHMGTMHGHGYHLQGFFGSGPLDEAAARKSFQTMAETQKAMFELQLDERKKIDAVLTKDQREKLNRYWSRR